MKIIPERDYEGIPPEILELIRQPIEGDQIVSASIINAAIKDACITTDKIAANTITASNIAANTITASQITANTITTSELNFTPYVIGTNDLDDVVNGTDYERILATDISSGHIKLTSNTVIDGEWYDESGVEIDAATGINIYGTANALTTRATKAGTIQCYVGSDGAIYAGAGAVKLDSTGIRITGTDILSFGPSGNDSNILQGAGTPGSLWVTTEGHIILVAGDDYNIMIDNPLVPADGADTKSVGTTTYYFSDTVTKILTLFETTTPSAVANFGKVYTKTDNNLYFQDGAGSEHHAIMADDAPFTENISITKTTPIITLDGSGAENGMSWVIKEIVYGAASWIWITNTNDTYGFYIKEDGMIECHTQAVIRDTAADPGSYPNLLLEATADGKDNWNFINQGTDLSIASSGSGSILLNETTTPTSAGGTTLGTTTKEWSNVVSDHITLKEITTPTAVATWGKIYTKNDNLLYFQSGDEAEHVIAFA